MDCRRSCGDGLAPAMAALLAGSLLQVCGVGSVVAGVAGIDGDRRLARASGTDSLIGSEAPPGAWTWPVVGRMTTEFGGCTAAMCPHWGVDIAAPAGTPCWRPPTAWSPKWVGTQMATATTSFWTTAAGGRRSMAHLQSATIGRFAVKLGASVRMGDPIGGLGSSGASTGPHLHFEVRRDGAYIDPTRVLRL